MYSLLLLLLRPRIKWTKEHSARRRRRQRPKGGQVAAAHHQHHHHHHHHHLLLLLVLLTILHRNHYLVVEAREVGDNRVENSLREGELDAWELSRLDESDSVPNEGVSLSAHKKMCAWEWSRDKQYFGCERDHSPAKPGESVDARSVHRSVMDLNFLVTLTVHKEDRARPSLTSLTNCTGYLIDGEYVLAHAQCVGPRTDSDVTMRIRVYKPHVKGVPSLWASRVCWSHRLWLPGAPRAPYDLAVVRLESRWDVDSRDTEGQAACLPPDGWHINPDRTNTHPFFLTECSLLQFCQGVPFRGADEPFEPARDTFYMTPVMFSDNQAECRLRYGGPINGPQDLRVPWEKRSPSVPPFVSCFHQPQNTSVRPIKCPHETVRAIFCWSEGAVCRAGEYGRTDRDRLHLSALAPMDFHEGQQAFYRPLEARGTPNNILLMTDLQRMHGHLKEMLVDAKVHNHGGSARSICRNLATGPTGPPPGLVRAVAYPNTGFRFPFAGPVGARQLNQNDLPGGRPDAWTPSKCWDADRLLDTERVWDKCSSDKEDWRRIKSTVNRRLPFLAEVRVRKNIYVWENDVGVSTGVREHVRICDAWLVGRDMVLTHAECLKPENHFDIIESASVHFQKPELWQADRWWPANELTASKVCWAREAAPYHWRRGFELAAVHFEPPLEHYVPDWLQPACLPVRGGNPPQEPHPMVCSLLIACGQQRRELQHPGPVASDADWAHWDHFAAWPVAPIQVRDVKARIDVPIQCDWEVDYMVPPEPRRNWLLGRYNATQTHCYILAEERRREEDVCGPSRLNGTGDGPLPQPILLATSVVMCKPSCELAHSASFLMAVNPVQKFKKLPGISYGYSAGLQEISPTTFQVKRDQMMMPMSSMILGRRQVLELMLALRGDAEGTRDVVCQMLKGPLRPPAIFDQGGQARADDGPSLWEANATRWRHRHRHRHQATRGRHRHY